jgi:hypothetical protein
LCWEFFPIVFKLQMSSIADIRRSTRPFVDDKKEDDFFQIDVRFLLNILIDSTIYNSKTWKSYCILLC